MMFFTIGCISGAGYSGNRENTKNRDQKRVIIDAIHRIDFYKLNPLPNLPPRGQEQNLAPLGEIRKGVLNNKEEHVRQFTSRLLNSYLKLCY
jgi:hypothetical protein